MISANACNSLSAESAIAAVQSVRHHNALLGSAPKSLEALEQSVGEVVALVAAEHDADAAAPLSSAYSRLGAMRANYGFLLDELGQANAKLGVMASLLASPKGRLLAALWLLEDSAGDDEDVLADVIEEYRGAADVLADFQRRFRNASYVVSDREADRLAAMEEAEEAA